MIKNKIKTIVTIILAIIIIMTTTKSLAANDYTCNIQLLGNKEQLKRGESITILVKATDIQAGDGIAAYSTVLEYDSNVFNCKVTGDDDEVWSKIDLLENVLTMKRSDMVANSEDQIITKIVLTAKEDAPIGSYTFKLTKISFTAGEETFTVNDVSATIPIVNEDETGDGNNPGGNTQGGDNNNDNNDDNNNNNDEESGNNNEGNGNENGSGSGSNDNDRDNNNEENGENSTPTPNTPNNNGESSKKESSSIGIPSSSNDNLPKTGITDWLITGIILGIITSIIFYIKYKRAYEE